MQKGADGSVAQGLPSADLFLWMYRRWRHRCSAMPRSRCQWSCPHTMRSSGLRPCWMRHSGKHMALLLVSPFMPSHMPSEHADCRDTPVLALAGCTAVLFVTWLCFVTRSHCAYMPTGTCITGGIGRGHTSHTRSSLWTTAAATAHGRSCSTTSASTAWTQCASYSSLLTWAR